MSLKNGLWMGIFIGTGSCAVLSGAGMAAADVPDACEARQEILGATVANRFLTTGLGCVVQITPQQKPEMVYRDYWFDERGRFLVFTSTTGDDVNTSTGTRSFFLFPRHQRPDFKMDADSGTVTVSVSTGAKLIFSLANARVQGFPGCRFAEDPTVGLADAGGFEILSFTGLMLDTGWQLGSTAYSHPERESVFQDAAGRRCSVKNTEVFSYDGVEYGEPDFIYETDAALSDFLKKRCPALSFSNII